MKKLNFAWLLAITPLIPLTVAAKCTTTKPVDLPKPDPVKPDPTKDEKSDVKIEIILDKNEPDKITPKEEYNTLSVNDLGHDNFKLTSLSSQYDYEFELLESNVENGTITLKVDQLNKNDQKLIKTFEIKVEGFKKELAPDEKDPIFSIEGINADDYKNFYAYAIEENKIKFESKSKKYTYKLRGIEVSEEKVHDEILKKDIIKSTSLIINYDQLDTKGNKVQLGVSYELKGFKGIELDKNDPKILFDGLEESKYNEISAEDAFKKIHSVVSKSGAYSYTSIKKESFNNTKGEITFKVTQWSKNKLVEFGTFEIVISGFKK